VFLHSVNSLIFRHFGRRYCFHHLGN